MRIKTRHFALLLGYDPAWDLDCAATLLLFRRADRPTGHSQYWFTFSFGCLRPRFRRWHGAEFDNISGAINSARWTGRNHEIIGWGWPVWLEIRVGRRFLSWGGPHWERTPAWMKRRAQRARQRQERLNSAMITASIRAIRIGWFAPERKTSQSFNTCTQCRGIRWTTR